MNDNNSESYRVNVPASDAGPLTDGPDSGYALVKYSKDDDGYCLDLKTLRLPDTQPEEDNPEDELSLEELGKKIMNEPEMGDEDDGTE